MSDEQDGAPKAATRPPSSRRRSAPVIEGEARVIAGGTHEASAEDTSQEAREAQAPPQLSATASNDPPLASGAVTMPDQAPPTLVKPIIAGGLAGVLATLVVMAVTMLVGGLANSSGDEAGTRLTGLEKRLQSLEARPAIAAGGAEIKKLADDVASLRQSVDGFAARLAARPAGADTGQGQNDLAILRQSIVGLEQKLAATPNIAALTADIAALRREIAARPAGGGEPAALLLVAVDLLKGAVDRGQAYAGELEAARALGLAADIADRLAPAAPRGVATARQLADLLRDRVGPMLDSLQQKPDGIAEQLLQSLTRLVRVRPVGEVAGLDPASRLARLEARLQTGDAAGALEELTGLPAPMQAASGLLAEGLRLRVMADRLLSGAIADLVKSLSRKG